MSNNIDISSLHTQPKNRELNTTEKLSATSHSKFTHHLNPTQLSKKYTFSSEMIRLTMVPYTLMTVHTITHTGIDTWF